MSETSRRGLVIKYKDVAAYLAHEGDDVQADFFNTFAEEMRICCETDWHAQTQTASFMMRMSAENKETLMMGLNQ